jgi:O-antigen/teichoic acid export membrane protein
MSFAARVLRNTSILIGTHLVTYSISLVVFGILARHLEEVLLGRFFVISTVASFAVLFSSLGLDVVLIREAARDRSKTRQYLETALALKIIFPLVLCTLLVIGVIFLVESAATRTAYYWMTFTILFSSWSTSFQSVFNAHEKMGYRSITLFVLNLVQLTGVIFVWVLDGGLVETIIVYHVFGSFSGLLVSGYFVRWKFTAFTPRLSLPIAREMLQSGLRIFAGDLAGRTYLLSDILIAPLLLTESMVGWYSAPKKLVEALHMFTSALTHALYPAMANQFEKQGESRLEMFHHLSRIMMYIGLPAGLFIFFCARGIIALIFGLENFTPSITIMRMFAPVVFLLVYDTFATYFVSVIRQERLMRRVAISRMVLNIIGNFGLMYAFGFVGGVLATGLSNIYNLSGALLLIRWELGRLWTLREFMGIFLRPVLVNLVFALGLIPLQNLNVIAAAALAGLSYLVLLILFGELNVRRLKQLGIIAGKN